MEKREALFYEKLNGNVRCKLCPHECLIPPGKEGLCWGKKNIDGKLYAVNYGEVVSIGIDPMEKKPLYHFYPGKEILSVAPNGCNLRCPYCQNYTISQERLRTEYISPEELVKIARRYNSIGICFTYSEPLIWYEYIMDVANVEKDMKIVLVTNGTINEEPFLRLAPYIDAMNIDLKSMDPEYYRKTLKGELKAVLRTIELAYENGIHVEITNLLIPTINDSPQEIKKLVEWVASLSKKIPLHFTRYFPHYRWELPPTPIESLMRAYEIGRRYLYYVYLGNVWSEIGNDTHCPSCGNLLVERRGFYARILGIEEGTCKKCGKKVDFVL